MNLPTSMSCRLSLAALVAAGCLAAEKPLVPVHQPRQRLVGAGAGVFRRWSHRELSLRAAGGTGMS